MVKADAVRKLALSLPESEERTHGSSPSFRVRNRIYATLSRDGLRALVKVMDRADRDALFEKYPDSFYSGGKWTELGWMGVNLDRVDADLFSRLVVSAWKRLAPKRALRAYEEPKEPTKGPSPGRRKKGK